MFIIYIVILIILSFLMTKLIPLKFIIYYVLNIYKKIYFFLPEKKNFIMSIPKNKYIEFLQSKIIIGQDNQSKYR